MTERWGPEGSVTERWGPEAEHIYAHQIMHVPGPSPGHCMCVFRTLRRRLCFQTTTRTTSHVTMTTLVPLRSLHDTVPSDPATEPACLRFCHAERCSTERGRESIPPVVQAAVRYTERELRVRDELGHDNINVATAVIQDDTQGWIEPAIYLSAVKCSNHRAQCLIQF